MALTQQVRHDSCIGVQYVLARFGYCFVLDEKCCSALFNTVPHAALALWMLRYDIAPECAFAAEKDRMLEKVILYIVSAN
jgi:hypothetical protein